MTDLSQLVGCAKSHAANLKAVLNADHELRTLIDENKIRNLEKAALIAGIKSKDIRESIVSECLAGTPFKKLKLLSLQGERAKHQPKKMEARGRLTANVQFGSNQEYGGNKFVLDAVLKSAALSHISPYFKNIDKSNHRSLSETFKNLVKKLEELHSEKKNYD